MGPGRRGSSGLGSFVAALLRVTGVDEPRSHQPVAIKSDRRKAGVWIRRLVKRPRSVKSVNQD